MPGPARLTKLAIQPLMERGGYQTANDLGRVVGASRSVIQQAKTRGIPIHRADKWALLCGFLPIEIWGELFYQAEVELEAAAGVTLLVS